MPPKTGKGKPEGGSKILYFFLAFAAVAFIHIFYQYSYHEEQDRKFNDAIIEARKVLQELQAHLPDPVAESVPDATHSTVAIPAIINKKTDQKLHQLQGSSRADISHVASGESSDIVIGMAQDTDPKNLVTFCASLRKHSQADVVLFMNSPFKDLNKEIAMKYNIRLIPFSLHDFPDTYHAYHPSTLRWSLIYDFFQELVNKDKYQRVWMIDVRDSMFQGDPFAMLPPGTSAFHVFKGVETIPIGQCGWNGGWIKDCFGDQMLKRVGTQSIICSGVSVGSIDTVLPYLSEMKSITMGQAGYAKFPTCERNGVDQGVHNVLVHTNKIKNVKVFSQNSSPVLNLQAKMARVEGMKVYNNRRELVPVVHQYDRYPDLQKALFKEYVYWLDTSDPEAVWRSEPTCSKFAYEIDRDMFKGKCDFKVKGGATDPSSCCAFCSQHLECEAFTFFNGQCFMKSGCGVIRPGMGARVNGAVSGYRSSE